jgi:hypothetical protein
MEGSNIGIVGGVFKPQPSIYRFAYMLPFGVNVFSLAAAGHAC